MTQRRKLFISYSHEDIKWLQAIKEQLAVLETEGLLDVYEDTQLEGGETWFEKLDTEMLSAKLGLLLISAPFLSSGFIRKQEVPRLFDKHAKAGMRIYPLLVRPCLWEEVKWLKRLQLRPQDSKRKAKAVSAFKGAAREQVLVNVTNEILSIVKSAANQPLKRTRRKAST